MNLSVALVAIVAASASAFQHDLLVDSRNGVRLRWSLTGNEIQMQMEAQVSGYVAVGWSKSGGMPDSFVAFGSAEAAPVELILTSKDSSGITRASDLPLSNTSASTANGLTTMTFTRAIRHPSRPIPIATDTTMIWAVHNSYRGSAQHTAQGAFLVNLSTGASRPQLSALVITHGVLMFAAFVVLFPSGVLWARFRDKANPDRIGRHRQIQGTATAFALIAFVLIVISIGDDGEHFEGLHAVAGLIVIIVLVVQMVVAFLRPDFGSALRRPWQLFHIWAGRLLFTFGPIVAIVGALLYMDEFGSELTALLYLAVIITIGLWALGVVLAVKERRDNAAS